MKNETKATETNTAYGKKLEAPLKFEFTWANYETIDEIKAANDMPSDDEVIKFRNTQRELSARGKALTKALDEAAKKFTAENGENVINPFTKPTIANDEQLRLKEMLKVLMASKRYTEDEARALASSTLGIEWATE